MASSGSVVPAEVLGEALAGTVDDGTGLGTGAETGAETGARARAVTETGVGAGTGAGAEAGAGAAVQTGKRKKTFGNKTQRTKQKLAFPTPQA